MGDDKCFGRRVEKKEIYACTSIWSSVVFVESRSSVERHSASEIKDSSFEISLLASSHEIDSSVLRNNQRLVVAEAALTGRFKL